MKSIVAKPGIKKTKSYLEEKLQSNKGYVIRVRDLKKIPIEHRDQVTYDSLIKFTIYHSSSKTRLISRICLAQLFILFFQSWSENFYKLILNFYFDKSQDTTESCWTSQFFFWSGKTELRLSVASYKIREKVAR